MTLTTPTALHLPPVQRVVYGIPLVGRIAREIGEDVTNVFYLLVVVITLEVLAFRLWGPAVFTLSALALVPLMFVFFLAISWPGRSRPKALPHRKTPPAITIR